MELEKRRNEECFLPAAASAQDAGGYMKVARWQSRSQHARPPFFVISSRGSVTKWSFPPFFLSLRRSVKKEEEKGEHFFTIAPSLPLGKRGRANLITIKTIHSLWFPVGWLWPIHKPILGVYKRFTSLAYNSPITTHLYDGQSLTRLYRPSSKPLSVDERW